MLVFQNFYNDNNMSFGKKKKSGKRAYTKEERVIRREIKDAAKHHGWLDVYTGLQFTKINPPTIEHIVPYSLRNTHLYGKKFQLNGLDNLFPAGAWGNNKRADERLAVTILKQPNILDRLLIEMEKYEKYKCPLIDGKDWVKRIKSTILRELEGICCDLSTCKISFIKNIR